MKERSYFAETAASRLWDETEIPLPLSDSITECPESSGDDIRVVNGSQAALQPRLRDRSWPSPSPASTSSTSSPIPISPLSPPIAARPVVSSDETPTPVSEFPIPMMRPPSSPAWGSAEYGQATDRGRVRPNNEDGMLAASLSELTESEEGELGYIFAVADGMGGAAAGECASRSAIEGLTSLIRHRFPHTPPWDRNTRWVRRQLRLGFERIDGDLISAGLRDPSLHGLGTTLTVVMAMGSALHVAHAGDSRAYLYRDSRLMRLTRDHTLAQAMIDNGRISREEADRHSGRHVLTNVLGSTVRGVDVDFLEIELRDGDRVLVCSDGLNEIVPDHVIASILGDNPSCQDAADELIAEALLRGGPDNVTAVVARPRVDW